MSGEPAKLQGRAKGQKPNAKARSAVFEGVRKVVRSILWMPFRPLKWYSALPVPEKVATIISVLSLAVSGYTLWRTALRPFELTVHVTGRVELTFDPHSPGARRPGIGLQLLFSNSGARRGFVDDVALEVWPPGGNPTRTLFRSKFEDLDDTLNFARDLPPPKWAPFRSFVVNPGDTVVKRIFFVPHDEETELSYKVGQYLFVPHTIQSKGAAEWKAWMGLEVDVEQRDIDALSQTTVTQTGERSRFVKLTVHSKPTRANEDSLRKLKTIIETK